MLTLTSLCKSRGFRRTQFLYLFICFLEKKIIYWEQYNIKITYCTEFYLKKKNHSSKLLLVNSHSFTSLMFPCSNLLGFSSFWLHCTGTRFWNQEKKRSMDTQLVSHSPEGHRLPCHCSTLTPGLCSGAFPHTRTDSWAAGAPRAPSWALLQSSQDGLERRAKGVKLSPHAVPMCHRSRCAHSHSAIQSAPQLPELLEGH